MLVTSKTAPIVGPLSEQSTIARAMQLKEGMIDWITGKEWEAKFSLFHRTDPELRQWHKKFDNTYDMIDTIPGEILLGNSPAGNRYCGFAYLFNGLPIGVMLVSEKVSCASIDVLVASPAASGAGCALIERAVRWSEEIGKSGRVSLVANNKDVAKVYERYGFVYSTPNWRPKIQPSMHLDPISSTEVWKNMANGWVLKSKIDKSYAVGGLTNEGPQNLADRAERPD